MAQLAGQSGSPLDDEKEKARVAGRKSYAKLSQDPEWKRRHFATGNAWRKANAERVREQARARWHADPAARTRKRAYHAANKEKFAAWSRKSNEKHYLRLMVRQAANRAKRDGLAFDLTEEWLRARWTNFCEVTGIEFARGKGLGRPDKFSPSIDKIRPDLGYIQSNCRVVIWAFNRFKNSDSDDVVLRVAKAIVDGGRLG